ncbi:hypothetical protein BJX64DRAFT_294485 [Aspergillus heterothallicus]
MAHFLQMHTNLGNTLIASYDELRYATVTNARDDFCEESKGCIEVLEPPIGNITTGFTVALESHLVWVYNDAWNLLRVVTNLTSPNAQLSCWDPGRFLERRPWAALQRVLWAGMDRADRLVSITGHYDYTSKKHITGLRFTYWGGVFHRIGDMHPDQDLKQAQFHPDESIRMVTLCKDVEGLVQITVSMALFLPSLRPTPPWKNCDNSSSYAADETTKPESHAQSAA